METDGRVKLHQALSLIEDSLIDGYRSNRPLPEFSEPVAVQEGSGQPSPHVRDGATLMSLNPRVPGAIPPGDSLEAIAGEAVRCQACRLAAGRKLVVPGQGSNHPLVMVIGEGPGAEEDRTGLPFIGPAGQLLDKMLASIGLSRETNCFIGNIVKCRPPMNRDPAPDEQAACMHYLDRQIAILKPRAFLAVGRIPAQALLGVKDGIGRLRGIRYEFRGMPLIATYHPSALLRDENLKRPAWEDLKLLKSILDGPG